MAISNINNWETLHQHKSDANKTLLRDSVMEQCGWSRDTFYRKLKTPEKLSPAEKKAIADVYDLPIDLLFPEA